MLDTNVIFGLGLDSWRTDPPVENGPLNRVFGTPDWKRVRQETAVSSPQLTGRKIGRKGKKEAGGKIMCGVDGRATVAPDGQMKHVYLQGSHLDSV